MSTNIKSQWWRPDGAPRTQWWRPTPAPDGNGNDVSPAATAAVAPSVDSKVPFWALFAFTFILIISPQSLFPVLAPLRIALIAAALALTAFVVNRFVTHQPIVQLTRESWIALLLLGWAVITVPFSYWPGGSVSVLVSIYIKSLVVFLLLSHIINTVPRLRLIAWGLSVMAIPLALAAVRNYLSGNYLQDIAPSDVRIQGYDAPLTGNPNDLALTLNLILPLAIGLFSASRKPGTRAFLLGLIGLIIVAVIATFSRGGFLTLAVILGIYLVLLCKRRGFGWAIFVLVLLLASTPFLPTSYLNRIATITNTEADTSGSAQERWTYMLAATKFTLTHPVVGTGVGMNVLALNQMHGPAWKEVHNVYLQYAMELGIPGFVLFLMLLRGCLKSTGEVRRRFAGRPERQDLFYLSEGIWVSLIAFAVAALFHPVAYHFYFYYFAGLALAAKVIGDAIDNDALPQTSLNTQTVRGST
jgi:probable O-glycosylation ligase (exosortase A-associated)